jgi:hypothetical protein
MAIKRFDLKSTLNGAIRRGIVAMEVMQYHDADASMRGIYKSQCSQTRSPFHSFHEDIAISFEFLISYFYSFTQSPIMHLGQQLVAALAVGVAAVLASSSVAVPVPGVQIRSPPIATKSPLAGDLSSRQGVELEPRRNINGQPAQKPLMGCPEMFNDPIFHCSSCGGESASTPGTCAKPNVSGWVCQCMLAHIEQLQSFLA